ncbi:hypothetical protein I7648_09580 [Collinsella tanakaei]|nr:hypothetical protein [Collinsella tanakaei]
MNSLTQQISRPLIRGRVIPKSILATSMLSLPMMLCCCLLNDYPITGLLSLAALLAVLIPLFSIRPLLLLKYLGMVFSWASTIIGCVVVEYSNMYLSELTVVSFFEGSLPLYCLTCWIFFVLLFLFDSRLDSQKADFPVRTTLSLNGNLVHYVSIAILVLLCVMFANVASRPSFMLGIDRFEYSSLHSLGLIGTVANFMNWLIVIPMLAFKNGERLLGGFCVILYCLYLFWTGTKFGGFFSVLCFIPLVYYDRILALDRTRLSSLAKRFGIAFVALLLVAVASFTVASDKDAGTYLQERTAQQGQLWWRTFGITQGKPHIGELSNELDATLRPTDSIAENVGANNGIYKIMYLCAPASIVDSKLESGSRYSSAGYAAAYYYGGSFGPIAYAALMSILVSFFTNLFVRMVTLNNAVLVILTARLFRICSSVASMFLFSELIEPISILSYCVIAIYLMLIRKQGSSVSRKMRTTTIRESFGV